MPSSADHPLKGGQMKIRQLVVGLLVAGVATVSGTSVAAAKSPSPHNPPSPRVTGASQRDREKEEECKHARERVEYLQRLKARVEARIDRLQKDLKRAREHHREDLAER